MPDDQGPAPTPEERANEFAERLAQLEARADAAEKRAVAAEAAAAPGGDLSRRDFLELAVGVTGGAVIGGLAGIGIGHWLSDDEGVAMVVAGDGSPDNTLVFYPRVEVASLSSLQNGQPVPFEYPLQGQTAQLVKLGKPAQYGLGPDADIVAFSTKCPHMGWPLEGTFNPAECVFGPCPGHFSTFDASVRGQVVLGQSTTNLPQIVLAIEDDTVYAEGVLGLIYGYRQNLLDGTPVEVT